MTIGALLGDTPHSRPIQCTGSATDEVLAARLGMQRSRYEGPTGIVGVLHDAVRRVGFASASIWAPVPHYVATPPNPEGRRARCSNDSRAARRRPRAHRPRHRGERVGTVGRRGRRRRRRRAARTSNGSSRATTRRPTNRGSTTTTTETTTTKRTGSTKTTCRRANRSPKTSSATSATSATTESHAVPATPQPTRSRARPSQRRVESTSDSVSTRSSLPWNIDA